LKPVFIEETIVKLKNIIDSTSSGYTDRVDIGAITEEIETSLKAYKDNEENKILFYGTSLVTVTLSLFLMYKTESSWPMMFLVIWLGGFLYYRVHEKSLVLDNLDKASKVKYDDSLSTIAYLKSAIDLKVGRKTVLKVFLSVLISSSVMMAHYLFVDTSFWMNFGLLAGAIVASYFFWNSFYKEDISALEAMKSHLNQLENQIILGSGYHSEEE